MTRTKKDAISNIQGLIRDQNWPELTLVGQTVIRGYADIWHSYFYEVGKITDRPSVGRTEYLQFKQIMYSQAVPDEIKRSIILGAMNRPHDKTFMEAKLGSSHKLRVLFRTIGIEMSAIEILPITGPFATKLGRNCGLTRNHGNVTRRTA